MIDIEHVLFWMDAIRNSRDPIRTLESFWKGQIRSKLWLIDNLKPFISKKVDITIYGGWNGVLASLLFQSSIDTNNIKSIDIDPNCKETANTVNKIEEMNGRFEAITADMCDIGSSADIIINTSCEHITQNQYNLWLNNLSTNSLIILQSNNYNIPEHIRCHASLDEFKKESHLKIIWEGEMPTQLYTRYMVIGFRNV